MRYDPSTVALFTPEAQGPQFGASGNWSREAQCAELARLAYLRFEEGQGDALVQGLAAGGFEPPTTFNDPATDAQGYATVGRDGTAYVVFRGTQPDRATDILCDADAVPVSWPGGGRVHRGFLRAANALFPAVDAWLGERGGADLMVTGHSLGAAMATLLAARVPRAALVTLGSPRVGNRDFARLLAGRDVWRYVDCCDRVADLPPAVGYKHLDGERYIDRTGRVLASPPGFLDRELDQAEAALDYLRRYVRLGNAPTRGFADHAPVNYLSAILGVREGP